MNKQTIFIIVIIVFFNFLLLNIFRLQNDLFSLMSYNNDKDNLPGINKNKYKPFNNNDDNNNDNCVLDKLNNISSLVDIDMNKIDKTDAKFTPKYKQVKTT